MVAPREYRLHTLAWREVDEADVWYLSRDYDTSVEFLSDLGRCVGSVPGFRPRIPGFLRRDLEDHSGSHASIVAGTEHIARAVQGDSGVRVASISRTNEVMQNCLLPNGGTCP